MLCFVIKFDNIWSSLKTLKIEGFSEKSEMCVCVGGGDLAFSVFFQEGQKLRKFRGFIKNPPSLRAKPV